MATEIETLIRKKLERARQENDSWIRKRANRNVFNCILDLAHSVGEAEATRFLNTDGGTLEGTLFTETLLAASKNSELKPEAADTQSDSEDLLVGFALKLASLADTDKVSECVEKLRHERYPA